MPVRRLTLPALPAARAATLALAVASGLLGGARTALAQAEGDSLRTTPVTLPEAGRSRGRDAAAVAGAAALLAGAALLDRRFDEAVPDGGGTRLEGASDALNHFGRPQNALVVLGGTWAAGKLADRPALSEGAAHVLAGLAVAGVANGALKYAVGRQRPETTDDPHRFRPFNGDNRFQAFPSGHAVVAFSLAASVSEEAKRPWVTALAYGTATAVAWSRVYEDKHWTSDVVGGALVGTLAGRGTVAWLHRRRERAGERAAPPRIAVVPGGVVVSVPAR